VTYRVAFLVENARQRIIGEAVEDLSIGQADGRLSNLSI
jgi:hypothetical protein